MTKKVTLAGTVTMDVGADQTRLFCPSAKIEIYASMVNCLQCRSLISDKRLRTLQSHSTKCGQSFGVGLEIFLLIQYFLPSPTPVRGLEKLESIQKLREVVLKRRNLVEQHPLMLTSIQTSNIYSYCTFQKCTIQIVKCSYSLSLSVYEHAGQAVRA